MIQILLGSIVLSIVHASIPNHWMPLVAIGNTEKWNTNETLSATGIVGFAHVLSTVLIGLAVGWTGYAIYSQYEWVMYSVGPAVLILLGIIYLALDRHNGHNHHLDDINKKRNVSKISLIGTLGVAMFFSPCLELETYYFTAGMHGWKAIIAVSIVYLVITVAGMIVWVYLGIKGLEKYDLHIFEHHEKAITGWVLIVIGLATLFFNT
ncbi:MAG: hypothetical protein PVH63_11790 [Balneolaceae bacterium]|jgi:hypothetical protein